MKRLLLALILSLLHASASAQCNGVFSANTICGTVAGGIPGQVPTSVLTGVPGGANGQIQYNNSGAFGGFTAGGDLTFAVPNFTVNTFGTAQSGKVPASGGGTTNFLRADATWDPVATSVFTRTGAVVATLHDYNSSLIDTTSALTGGVLRTQLSKNGDIINAADFGVVCDGSTVNTTAWAAAISAFPTTGGILDVPRGICIGTVVLNKPIIFRGQGWSNSGSTGTCGSEIRSTAAADNVILISSQGVQVRDLCVTSSVAVGSRTGAGIKVTSGPNVLISRVFSSAHKYGVWNQGAGNEFEHVFTVGNQTYGMFFDGSTGTGSLNETGIYFCQANGNLGTAGIGIVAGGFASTGIFMVRPTAATNTGAGILISGAINDIHITVPELSSNTLNQLDAVNGSGGNLTVSDGLIETVTGGGTAFDIGTAQQFVTVTGSIITSPGGTTMILAGIQSVITGNIIVGGGTAAVISYGAAANNMTISGNTITGNSGAGEVGISIAAGLTGCMIGANVFTTLPIQISDGTAACTYAAITTTKPTYP